MASLDIQEAQNRLAEVVVSLQPGEEVILTKNGLPVARLVKAEKTGWPCKAGSAKDTVHSMAPDFDAPLDEFKEYMG